MKTENNIIQSAFDHFRKDFVVIGFTGATGSGCSTAATIIEEGFEIEKLQSYFSGCQNSKQISADTFNLEFQRFKRIKNQIQKEKKDRVFIIKPSNIILILILYILNTLKKENQDEKIQDQKIKTIAEILNLKGHEGILKNLLDQLKDNVGYSSAVDEFESILNPEIPQKDKKDSVKSIEELKEKMKNLREGCVDKINKGDLTKLLQKAGDGIRGLGKTARQTNNPKSINILRALLNPFSEIIKDNKDSEKDEATKNDEGLDILSIFIIPEVIRRIISIVKQEYNIILIDSLRNIYEIEYIRQRYSAFYLFSILCDQPQREQRLKNINFNDKEIRDIFRFEQKKRSDWSQDINKCIYKGDIFIDNSKHDLSKLHLTYQLAKYLTLIKNPGIVTPTDDERYMQLAFTARYNSGCISRQVGAVIVGRDGYILGVGWNDVPEGNIPCLYRIPDDLLSNSNSPHFSEYEKSETFFNYIKKKYGGSEKRKYPFCFKDIQNEIESKEKINDGCPQQDNECRECAEKIYKNPTRERSLHAEENAFLQVTKVGGTSIKGSTLYTTDSPCQLCSKKAMQLHIKRIVYIDAYPDISIEHTLMSGTKYDRPSLEMFTGAIGQAYFKLYIPFVEHKDYIKMVTSFEEKVTGDSSH